MRITDDKDRSAAPPGSAARISGGSCPSTQPSSGEAHFRANCTTAPRVLGSNRKIWLIIWLMRAWVNSIRASTGLGLGSNRKYSLIKSCNGFLSSLV
jgi:hypothetical protein